MNKILLNVFCGTSGAPLLLQALAQTGETFRADFTDPAPSPDDLRGSRLLLHNSHHATEPPLECVKRSGEGRRARVQAWGKAETILAALDAWAEPLRPFLLIEITTGAPDSMQLTVLRMLERLQPFNFGDLAFPEYTPGELAAAVAWDDDFIHAFLH